MNIPCPTTIAEVIWYFLVVVVAAAFVELRWTIHKMITKLDELPEKYVTQKYMDKWEEGRDGPGGLWEALNKHGHNDKGKVTRA